ncbi:hypothetical protein ACYOEI_34775, partial [Singulisphaera rosea]
MFLELYHPASRQVFRGKRGQGSEYGHVFGGVSNYAGLAAFSGQPTVHLLLRRVSSSTRIASETPSMAGSSPATIDAAHGLDPGSAHESDSAGIGRGPSIP